MSKPLWKEAYELANEYKKRGIKYCYNQRNHMVYLSVLSAPEFVPDKKCCQLTGWLEISGVPKSRDINNLVTIVKNQFINTYKDNPEMIKYAMNILD